MKSKPILNALQKSSSNFKLGRWRCHQRLIIVSSLSLAAHDDNMKKPNCACQKCVFSGICSFHFSASIFILNIASKDLGIDFQFQFSLKFFFPRIKAKFNIWFLQQNEREMYQRMCRMFFISFIGYKINIRPLKISLQSWKRHEKDGLSPIFRKCT
jgi:hypothetical protein